MSKFQRKSRPNNFTTAAPNIKNLFELIRDEKMVIEHIATAWIQLYQTNDNEAYLIILNFLLESVGLEKALITSHDLESQDMEAILTKVYKKLKDTDDYPLISKSKTHKSFYLNFQHFWIYLVTEAGDALYDESMLTFLTNWMSSFSFSNYRSIRHTSTLALLSLGQALVDILVKETSDLERVQTFIRTEMQNSDTQRLHHLQIQEKDLTQRLRIINKELDELYNDVLKFRCLDVVMEVRAVCIQGLHYMTDKFPEKFIKFGALDIVRYGIYDKIPEVRMKCLEFLNGILTEENMPVLKNFLENQKLRLVEMTHDIDNKCSVAAINLTSNLAKLFPLSQDEKQIVACLVWAENEEIRNSACNFLLGVIFKDKLPVDHSISTGMCIDQGKQFDSEKSIMKLVKFHKDFKETQMCRIEIIIQTLWNKTSAVKCWEAMCELLKRGERSNTTQLSEVDKKIIMYMLISGLKFISTSSDKKQKHTMISLTSTLIQQLPSLLIFYSLDYNTLKELVKIPMYLDLSALSSKDLKDPFQRLVNILIDLHVKADDPDIIFRTTQSLAKLARDPHSLQKEAKHDLMRLVNDICTNLTSQLKQFSLGYEEKLLKKWLLRTESVIAVYDILDEIGKEPFRDIIAILSQYLSNSINDSTLASSSAGIMYFYHLWNLNKITKTPEELGNYCSSRSTIIENFTAIVAKPDCESNLKYKTFKYLCETLMVVSSQAAFGSPLHYEVSKDVWTTIEEYILSKPVAKINPNVPIPANAFYKFGAKDEPIAEDADEASQTICLLVARIISFCPSIITSHLPSSFFAHFGISSLKSISLVVRQVIVHYKTKESQQSGVFADGNLFFSIVLESLIKCLGTGNPEDIANMKDLAKKFTIVMGTGAMRPKQADKLLAFVLDGISFAFSDKDNFQILEGINVFLSRGYLSPIQMRELFDRISKDADTIENKIKEHENETDLQTIMYPIKHFLYNIGKVVGIARQPPVLPSERTKKQMSRRREDIYKKKDDLKIFKLKNNDQTTTAIKKSAFNLVEEYTNAVKKSSITDDQIYFPQVEDESMDSNSNNVSDSKHNSDSESESVNDLNRSELNINLPSKRLIREYDEQAPITKSIKKLAISELKNLEESIQFNNKDKESTTIKKGKDIIEQNNVALLNGFSNKVGIKKNSIKVDNNEVVKPTIKKISVEIHEKKISDKDDESEEYKSDDSYIIKRPIKSISVKKY